MALSRLRLRLTAVFAVAFFVGIAVVEGASYVYIVWTGSYEFNDHLKVAAKATRAVIQREADHIRIDSTIFDGVSEGMDEFKLHRSSRLVVYNSGRHTPRHWRRYRDGAPDSAGERIAATRRHRSRHAADRTATALGGGHRARHACRGRREPAMPMSLATWRFWILISLSSTRSSVGVPFFTA